MVNAKIERWMPELTSSAWLRPVSPCVAGYRSLNNTVYAPGIYQPLLFIE